MKNLVLFMPLLFLSSSGIFAQQQCIEDCKNVIQLMVERLEKTRPHEADSILARLKTVTQVPGSKVVYWVHGLSGDEGSWAKAAGAAQDGDVAAQFPDYDIVSSRQKYTQFGMKLAAEDLRDGMDRDKRGLNPRNNFIIAHSQGGIVSRRAYADYIANNYGINDRQFQGIATFGTPHRGARIINNLLNSDGSVSQLGKDFLQESCKTLLDGPTSEFRAEAPLLLRYVLSFVNPTELKDAFCEILGTKLPDLAFQGFRGGLTQDFKVDAPALNQLNSTLLVNNNNEVIEQVAFYGTEDQATMSFRTIYGLTNSPNANLAERDNSFFDANKYEDAFVNEMADNRNMYASKHEYFKTGYFAAKNQEKGYCGPLGFFTLFLLCDGAKKDVSDNEKARDGYLKGVQFFDNFNNKWLAMIGALDIQYQNEAYCKCYTEPNGYPVTADRPNACTEMEQDLGDCYTYHTYNTITTYKEADGVALVESASDNPGATVPPVKMEKSNHQQMRTDLEARDKLRDLFNGNHGDFFRSTGN